MAINFIPSKNVNPTKPFLIVNSQAASFDVYYTILDITGRGILNRMVNDEDDTIVYRITVDGVSSEVSFWTVSVDSQFFPNIRFYNSLKIEMKTKTITPTPTVITQMEYALE